MDPRQLLLLQSEARAQATPSAQRRQVGSEPPQSTPVSVPFLRLSLQEMGVQMPRVHGELAQSPFTVQVSPSGQRRQLGLLPPQSVSASVPFRRPSEQEMQVLPAQSPLAQSVSTRQETRSAQRAQVGSLPPQSTPDSLPLTMSSSHSGRGWQVPWQMPVWH